MRLQAACPRAGECFFCKVPHAPASTAKSNDVQWSETQGAYTGTNGRSGATDGRTSRFRPSFRFAQYEKLSRQ